MVDHKSPRSATDALGTLTALLDYQRASLVRKVDGLTTAQAAWSPVPSGTSLLWLIGHMADAEQTWIVRRFAGLPVDLPGGATTGVTDDLDRSVAAYRATWKVVDTIVADVSDPGELCRGDDTEPPCNLLWVMAHLLEETARHAGHADILRELVDGQTGR
jgi:uncharacterized protein DUF664